MAVVRLLTLRYKTAYIPKMGRPRAFDIDCALSAATELFWRNGYGATPPSALVDALGIGKGSLYNAFESKHALFEQALRRYGDARVASVTQALEEPGPVRARLLAALTRIAAPENTGVHRRGCFAVNAAAELGPRDKLVLKIVAGVFSRMEQAFQNIIEEGQQCGELRSDRDPEDLAAMLLTFYLGTTITAKTLGEPEHVRTAVSALLALLFPMRTPS
jgi:TetR/AcrR family transcriptional regulator, transcriptional repressor for nem operon